MEKRKSPTWMRVLENLQRRGARTSLQVGKALGMTSMGARQHLLRLEEDGLVTSHFEKRKTGRPALVFELSEEAARYFPQNYDQLASGILHELAEMEGREQVLKLLDRRRERMERDYLEKMDGEPDPKRRAELLAKLRDDDGYMAEHAPEPDGTPTIVEHNCPIARVAKEFPEVCQSELELLERVTGARVERVQHMAQGHYACVYRIHANGNGCTKTGGNGSEPESGS